MGRALSPDETRSCVGCHTTAAVSGEQLNLDRLMPGIRCEACHGPGEKHVKAMKSGNLKIRHIFNPGLLSPDELSQEFCGRCHRSAEEVIQMPGRGDISNIRFQPYRIFHSKCYTDDERISCVACHNPHQGLNHDPMFYDSRCLACHGAGSAIASQKLSREPTARADAPACPQGTSRCVSCHMPKMGLPGSHFEFTDHWIRINRPGTPHPI